MKKRKTTHHRIPTHHKTKKAPHIPAVPQQISWQAGEFSYHLKHIWWYIAVILVCFGLGVFLMLVIGEWLAGVAVCLFPVAFILLGSRQPKRVDYKLTQEGVEIGREKIPYNDLKSFWLVDSQKQGLLYFEPVGFFNPLVIIQLGGAPAEKVEAFLLQFLPGKETAREAFSDWLLRVLKL